MSHARDSYRELAHYLQIYLLQEYTPQERIPISRRHYDAFVAEAKARRYRTPTRMQPSPQPEPAAKPSPRHAQPQKTTVQPPSPQPREEKLPKAQSTATQPAPTEPTLNEQLASMKSTIARSCGNVILHDAPPDDTNAKRKRYTWLLCEVPILIVAPMSTNEQLQFYQQMASGISRQLAATAVVTNREARCWGGWEQLAASETIQLLLVCSGAFEAEPCLRKSWKDEESRSLLFDRPAILLQPLTRYQNDNAAKRALWQRIRTFYQPET